MRFASSAHSSLVIMAICAANPTAAKDREVGKFVSGNCFEHRGPAGTGKHIILCFDENKNLRGWDFSGGHGADFAAKWIVDSKIIIGDNNCRITITNSTEMVLADCYYQGLWTSRSPLPKD
jgi:hypothetical protein